MKLVIYFQLSNEASILHRLFAVQGQGWFVPGVFRSRVIDYPECSGIFWRGQFVNRHVSLKARIQQCLLKMEKFIHSGAMTRACWAVGRHIDEKEEGLHSWQGWHWGTSSSAVWGDSPTLNIRQSDIGMEHIQEQHWRPRTQHARNAKPACENAAKFFSQESGKQFQPYRAGHPERFPLHPWQLRAGPACLELFAFLGGRRGLGAFLTPANVKMKANSTAFVDI